MTTRLRPALECDIETVIAVHHAAYQRGPDARDQGLFHHNWRDWLVLEGEDQIVGVVRLVIETLRYGPAASVQKAEVGHVGIDPARQAQGLGTALMQAVVAGIRERGVPLARLGGYQPFYSRFGFQPFPRRFTHFPTDPVRAGAATIAFADSLRIDEADQACLRPYHPARDWSERARLEGAFLHPHLGALLPSQAPRPSTGAPDRSGLHWVYDAGDGLRGWVGTWASGDEAQIHGAFDPAHPSAAAALLKRVLTEVSRQGYREVLGRLPFSPALEAALVRGGVGFIQREVFTAPAGNMLLLSDLGTFVEAAAPEWSRRLAAAGCGFSGVLRLCVGDEEAYLRVTATAVQTVAARSAALTVTFEPREFLLCAMGYRGFGEVASTLDGDAPTARAMLAALWPRVATASGPLG